MLPKTDTSFTASGFSVATEFDTKASEVAEPTIHSRSEKRTKSSQQNRAQAIGSVSGAGTSGLVNDAKHLIHFANSYLGSGEKLTLSGG
jgi:hypothetical protein